MKASAANFLSLIKGPKQFVIPIYQRTYSWQIAQCNQLLKDILRISSIDSVPGHFIGSIVYFQESIHTQTDVPQLLVIDGQQRLTTISLLIAALANFIEQNNVELETTATKLRNYYLLNAEEESELRFKLLLTRRDKDTLVNLLKKNPLGGDPSPRIKENFEFFTNSISTNNVLDIYNGILRLFVVDVALEKDKDNPQLIFESLNSTGLDLSQADLIRNFVLMGQTVEKQTELYEHYWHPMEEAFGNEYSSKFDWFVRDYLSVKMGKIPRIGHVYDEFKSYIDSSDGVRDVSEVLKDLYVFSKYYVNMVLHKEPDERLLTRFRNITRLKVDVSYPFLVPVYADYSNGHLSKDDFVNVLDLVENYVFRRAICGIPTNSLNKTFGNLYKSVSKENYLESVAAAFQLMEGYQRLPTDMEFENEIRTKDLYNFRSRNYLLSRLENYDRKETVDVDEYTIEHVMPQNPNLSQAWRDMLGENWKEIQNRYLHTLGNLTLTGYNPELSDRSFSEKKSMKGGFDDSPLRLNKHMRDTNVWNEQSISDRSYDLAQKAKRIWQAPNLPDEILDKYRRRESATTTSYSLNDYKHLEGETLELFNHLRKRILNLDAAVKEEFTKLYIAYRSPGNFTEIVPQKSKLKLYLNINPEDLIDPHGMGRDVSAIGSWGSGDVEVSFSSIADLEKVMDLVQQAFDAQVGN